MDPRHSKRGLRFALALFASAFLLFSIEPMVAKSITPLLGGTPAVWISCMLFFQALLLAGYMYVHTSLGWLGARRQALVQLVLVGLPLLALPAVVDSEQVRSWNDTTNPTFSVLLLLARTVGPAFAILSMSGPLLQGWFAALPPSDPSKAGARDPYVLYAASNAGSVVALAAYPFLIEPFIGLKRQFAVWHNGYFAFVVLVAMSALPLLMPRRPGDVEPATSTPRPDETPSERRQRVRWRSRITWAALAFVPSTYMMGVTTFITTDVAPIPLFWVLPLLLYLVTFILVFAKRQLFSDAILDRAIVIGLTLSVAASVLGGAWSTILVHLATFFFVALFCHVRLVRMRPDASELTDFFLWLSIGGALGGLLNGVIAPTFFSRSLEFPIALVLAGLCRVGSKLAETTSRARLLDGAIPLGVGALLFAVLYFGEKRDLTDSPLYVLAVAIPFVLNYASRARVPRFALGIGAILLATGLHTGSMSGLLYIDRNFFGVIRVAENKGFHVFSSGNIIHGIQYTAPERRRDPLAYYHRRGPLGDVFQAYGDRLHSVGVVGLGAGTMAAYAKADQTWTFYEINPAVVRVAQTPSLFTYLSDAFPHERGLRVEVGDARLRIEEARDASYSLIVLDAFSSDAVPVHLLTREAIDLYKRKLEPHGLLAFHISNRFLRLGPVMASIAGDRALHLVGKSLLSPSKELLDDGLQPSTWLVMSESADTLEPLVQRGYQAVHAKEGMRVWTDDYSDIIGAYRL
ncbi:fused MFS/spermidine synthase [Pendulispora rubella]|uniref:Fused MFS/spermidine synthase n=1 Tax=Pendulispora rubella TaxID=2741070 RepID=A0ABZ2LI66_9BACT